MPAFFIGKNSFNVSDFIIESVSTHAALLLRSMELELVDVQFRMEAHGWVLRIIIDHEQGVSIDHCTRVSREISAWLDVEDLIEQAYNLEVSSPGAERPLKKPEDFQRFCGHKIRVKIREEIEGRKTFLGDLLESDENGLAMDQDGRRVEIPYSLIRRARLSL